VVGRDGPLVVGLQADLGDVRGDRLQDPRHQGVEPQHLRTEKFGCNRLFSDVIDFECGLVSFPPSPPWDDLRVDVYLRFCSRMSVMTDK